MVKFCTKCQQTKPLGAFTSNKSRKDGLNNICSECHKQYTQGHYQKNKQVYLAKASKRNHEVGVQCRAHRDRLKAVPCADCGNSYPPYVMDFDHVRGQKIVEVSKFCTDRGSLAKMQTEAEKCEVVCANCHRIRTHERKSLAL